MKCSSLSDDDYTSTAMSKNKSSLYTFPCDYKEEKRTHCKGRNNAFILRPYMTAQIAMGTLDTTILEGKL